MKTRTISLILASGLLAVSAIAAANGPKKHRITPGQAAKIALRRFPGKLVKSPNLEHEDGKWQYEVLVRSGGKLKEIDVDAVTGKIGDVENTSVAEEVKEAKSKKGD